MSELGLEEWGPSDSSSKVLESLDKQDEGFNEMGEGVISPLFSTIHDPFNHLMSLDSKVTGTGSQMNEQLYSEDSESTIYVVHKSKNLIGLEEIPRQEYAKVAREGTEFNIMVAGDRGLGKTTFINTLFEPYESGTSEIAPGNGTTEFRIYSALLRDKNFKLVLNAIDTPGFFDTTNDKFCWVPIANYIDEQFRLRYFQEEQPERGKMVDRRVHACIYFINPTSAGLTESDTTAMKNLCNRVNLIPVISKADTFTKDQIAKFKTLSQIAMEQNEIKLCSMLSLEALADVSNDFMPFSVIGAETYASKSDGTLVRGRAYNWGIAEVENDSHCEFNRLKELLMSSHMIDFIEGTQNHYEDFRAEMLQFRLQQFMKLKYEKHLECDEDLEDEVVEKLKLEQQNMLFSRVLKSDDSLEFIRDISKVTWESVEGLFAEQNPIFLESQQQIKKNFASIVCAQEKKFKEWKGALILKQKLFNKEIQETQRKVAQLQEAVEALETEYEDLSLSKDGTIVSQEDQ